jgi:hypothetical protein
MPSCIAVTVHMTATKSASDGNRCDNQEWCLKATAERPKAGTTIMGVEGQSNI